MKGTIITLGVVSAVAYVLTTAYLVHLIIQFNTPLNERMTWSETRTVAQINFQVGRDPFDYGIVRPTSFPPYK